MGREGGGGGSVYLKNRDQLILLINIIDKYDSHKRENLRHIDNQLTRQHCRTHSPEEDETPNVLTTRQKTTTGRKARQEQGRVHGKEKITTMYIKTSTFAQLKTLSRRDQLVN